MASPHYKRRASLLVLLLSTVGGSESRSQTRARSQAIRQIDPSKIGGLDFRLVER
jgi:hypothetical protein